MFFCTNITELPILQLIKKHVGKPAKPLKEKWSKCYKNGKKRVSYQRAPDFEFEFLPKRYMYIYI